MKLLLASSEVHPYSKTGGLADMVGALGKTLARAGHQTGIVTPLYAGIKEHFPGMRPLGPALDLTLGKKTVSGQIHELTSADNLTIYFVEQPGYFDREGLYQ